VKLHGCHDLPRPTPETFYLAQDGYTNLEGPPGEWTRVPKWKKIFHVMSTDCGYAESKNDSSCNGCHQQRT
jgi:hypothetical protein